MMTLDAVINAEMEDFLSSCDLTSSPLLIRPNDKDESTSSPLTCTASLQWADATPVSKPRRRGRKKKTVLDPATKREMDRVKERERCSSYRQRRRTERERLQQEVRALTAQVVTLNKANGETATVWKLFAQRQLEARLSSENQQMRLCEAIQARAKCILKFQELVQRQIANVAKDEDDEALCDRNAAEYDSCITTPFCNVFLQDLDTIYAQTDDCLRAFDDNSPMKVWKEDSETGSFQFMERQEMLCAFDEACQTLWDASQLPHRQLGRREIDGVPDPSNTSVFKFRVTTRLASGRVVSAVQRLMSRRYQTSNRMVLAWQSYMDGEGMFTGLRAGETGWDVLTPGVTTSGVETVIRRTVIWHTPMHIAGTGMPEAITKEFSSMTIGSVTQDTDEIAKRFQEISLDDGAV